MREIKFRGKTEGGEWIKGNLVCYREDDGEDVTCIVGDKRNEVDACVEFTPVDPKTVGQFTGLYDAEEKEIYEGDIVRHTIGKKNSLGNFVDDYHDIVAVYDGGSFNVSYLSLCLDYVEIIGNVYDNPELLSVN